LRSIWRTQAPAQTPQPFEVRRAEAVFEELPVLNASEILRPEFLAGPRVTKTFDDVLKNKSPSDLKIMNRKTLLALGAGEKETERFLNNTAFSPSEQTAFVLNLKSLDGVANRGAFVRAAGETSSDEQDAIFCAQTAALMSQIHKNEKPLARIIILGDFPICVAKDGTIIVALQWDYAAWT
jgi:hypothetical protein